VLPYLQAASQEQLESRLADILRNIYTLTGDGKLGSLPPERGGLVWEQKLTDLNLEYYRRSQDMEAIARPEHLPFHQAALDLVKANSRLRCHLDRKPVFCRYGELRWMRELYEEGKLLLSPASHYLAAEHGLARQDNELLLTTFVSPYHYDLGMLHPRTAPHLPPDRCWLELEHRKPSDHYLYCLTVTFDFRYFVDFGAETAPAEACVLIHDQAQFEERLIAAVSRVLPSWHVSFGMVRYVDPYFIIEELPGVGADIFYYKNFRYMYQMEYRLVALPPRSAIHSLEASLDRLPVTLGSLVDIADLLTLA
jgi:hypothetical protein